MAISIRQYARDRGCSDTAVHKAIRSGKIVDGVTYDGNGKPSIVPEIADREWKVAREVSISKSEKIDKAVGKEPQVVPTQNTNTIPPGLEGGGLVVKTATARLVKMTAEANIKQLEYKKKSGTLVEKEKVYTALFALGQEIKAAMLIIPDRYIDVILGAPDRNAAHKILTEAIDEALTTIAPADSKDLNLE
jgi:hypothetical protein